MRTTTVRVFFLTTILLALGAAFMTSYAQRSDVGNKKENRADLKSTLVAPKPVLAQVSRKSAQANQTAKNESRSQLPDDFAQILLNARKINTNSSVEQAGQKDPGSFNGKQLRLIQFAGPIKPEWYSALQKTGARIVTYIPFYSYLVYGDSASLSKVQNLSLSRDTVHWQGSYRGMDKIHPLALPYDGKGTPRLKPFDSFEVQLVEDATANVTTLAMLDGLKKEPIHVSHDLGYVNVKVRMDPNKIFDISNQPDVVSIQPYAVPKKMDERQDVIFTGNLSGNAPAAPGYLSFLSGIGFTQGQFTASGFGVDVTDSGIDNGTTTPNHFGLYVSGNTTLASRVLYNRLVGTPNGGSTIQGCDGHGNLNSHIVAGYSDLTGFPHEDASGYNYDLGVCPFVKVGSSVIFDPDTFTFPDFEDLQSMAYNNGMRISTNSWGASAAGAYNSDSQRYDALVRDAQPTGSTIPVAGNQEMVIVFSAGNDGSGSNSIGSPGTGKNMITVGAAENVQPFGGNDQCGIGDSGSDSANDIIDFSSRGPTDDGRIKPDLVGPGTHITGGVGQSTLAGNPPTGNGAALACYTASGVCGGTAGDPNFWPPTQQWTTASSGTSHSTPAVAGGAALLRQFFINNALTPPSPAMTKAFLVNSARYMNGTGANDTLPSNSQGFGMMNLGMAFDGTALILHDELPGDKFTASGQTRTANGTISDASKPFRVTIAWTDPPGPTSGNAFINDLDLIVTVGGNTYKGNVFSGANSTTGGSADPRDNVESVFIPAGVTGQYFITVNSTNIAGDGVPGDADVLDQDYALVCYNCIQGPPAPVISSAGASISGENCLPGNGAADPGETIGISIGLQNVGNLNTTDLVATLQATGGVTNPSAPQDYGVLIFGGAAVSRVFTFTVDPVLICGNNVVLTLALQDGSTSLGVVTLTLPTGALGSPSTFSYAGPAVAIPDNLAVGVDTTFTVSGFTGNIADLNFSIDGASCNAGLPPQTTVGLDHSWVGDIVLKLTSPSATSATFINRAGPGGFGSDGNNFCQTLLDDQSVGPNIDTIVAAGAPYTGTFIPQAALSLFNGENPNGTWTLNVSDNAAQDTGNLRAYSITVSNFACCTNICPTITLSPATLPAGTIGVAYTNTITASGGTGPYGFTVSSGSLPTGVTMDSAGNITGTPTAAGTFNFGITATDANGCTGLQSYSVTVSCPTITLSPNTLPNGTLSVPYIGTITASGGSGPYTFSVSTGSLPTGVSMDSAGNISGTPTAGGTYGFDITATDANGCLGTQSYSVIISCPGLVLTPPILPGGTIGVAYSQNVTASGGTGPYTYSVTTGTLPAGLSLDINTGAITGTPTTTEAQNFMITATDTANGCTVAVSYTIAITPPCLFCEEFNDATPPATWTYNKPANFTEASGVMTPVKKKKSTAVATPAFTGCQSCSVATAFTSTVSKSKIWIYAWRVDANTQVELQITKKKVILKQRSAKHIVKKATVKTTAASNGTPHVVTMSYDGTNLVVNIDGTDVIPTFAPVGTLPTGTVGLGTKGDLGAAFDYVHVN